MTGTSQRSVGDLAQGPPKNPGYEMGRSPTQNGGFNGRRHGNIMGKSPMDGNFIGSSNFNGDIFQQAMELISGGYSSAVFGCSNRLASGATCATAIPISCSLKVVKPWLKQTSSTLW